MSFNSFLRAVGLSEQDSSLARHGEHSKACESVQAQTLAQQTSAFKEHPGQQTS